MNITFNALQCVADGHAVRNDYIVLEFYVDGSTEPQIWKSKDDATKMKPNDRVIVGLAFQFQQSLVVKLVNYFSDRPGSPEDYGQYEFKVGEVAPNLTDMIKLTGPSHSDLYTLEYDTAENVNYVTLLGVKCVKPSTEVNPKILTQAFELSSSVFEAFAGALKAAPDPRAAAAGTALDAAAQVLLDVPDILEAVQEASTKVDEMYIAAGSYANPGAKIYPVDAAYVPIGEKEPIPLDFANIYYPMASTGVTFSFWDVDPATEDFLGLVNVSSDTEMGYHTFILEGPASQGNIYILSYGVGKNYFDKQPIPIPELETAHV